MIYNFFVNINKMEVALTGLPDTDIQILQQLDHLSLFYACQSNKYTIGLCKKDQTLKTRYNQYLRNPHYYVLLSGYNPENGRKIRINGPVYNQLMHKYGNGRI